MAKDDYRKGTHTIDLDASLVKLNLDDTLPINNLDETRPIVKPTTKLVAKQPVVTKTTNIPVQTNNTVIAKQETKNSAPRLQSIKYKSKPSPFFPHKTTNKTESNQKEDKTSKKTSKTTTKTSIPNTVYGNLGSYMSQRNRPTKKQEEYRDKTIRFIKDNIINTRNAIGNGRISYDVNKVLGTPKITVSGINKALRQSNKTNENIISNFIEMAIGGVRRQFVKDIANTDNNEKQSKKSLIVKSTPQVTTKKNRK